MNEFELIDRLTRSLPLNSAVMTGPGDDCAVLDAGPPGRCLLLKTDAVVEGIHFESTTPAERIGHKAIARCLSDIAAMAGRPIAALVTLALPRKWEAEFIAKIYDGMSELARLHNVAIVGGETTTNPERLLISVSMLGDVEREKCVLRSGARAGDALFVTGELGGSLAGKHLNFEPRLGEARWLADHFPIHAMIDISDGLAGDLRHILQRSHVGAQLLASAIPISRAAKLASTQRATRITQDATDQTQRTTDDTHHAPRTTSSRAPNSPLLSALTDGEDFELLFAVASRDAVPLKTEWMKHFPALRLSCIGKITAKLGLELRDEHGVRALESHGYVHFA